MKKELFVECINALEKQIKYDINVSEKLGEAFPDAFTPNLLPNNQIIVNTLIKVLEDSMNDKPTEDGYSYITWFCYETNFGEESYRLKLFENGENILIDTPSKLYDYLISK